MKAWWAVDPNQPSALAEIWRRIDNGNVDNWSIEQRNLLTKVCIGYILRIYAFRDMMVIGKPLALDITQWRQLRHLLLQDFRTVLGFKLLIIRCMVREMAGKKPRLIHEIHNGELDYNDIAVYQNLQRMHLVELCQLKLYGLPSNSIPNCQQVVKLCGEFFADKKLMTWIGKFANRKLKFLRTSQNLDLSDIVGDLVARGTETFYFLTPFLEPEHRRNTVKRAIHNYGMHMITESNKPENKRLRYNETTKSWENIIQGFSRVKLIDIEINQQNESADDVGDNSASYVMARGSHARLDNGIILKNYIRDNPDPIRLRVINLLAMNDDNEFISYIQNQLPDQKLTDNEMIYDMLGRRLYFHHIARFLRVRKSLVKSVVRDMKK